MLGQPKKPCSAVLIHSDSFYPSSVFYLFVLLLSSVIGVNCCSWNIRFLAAEIPTAERLPHFLILLVFTVFQIMHIGKIDSRPAPVLYYIQTCKDLIMASNDDRYKLQFRDRTASMKVNNLLTRHTNPNKNCSFCCLSLLLLSSKSSPPTSFYQHVCRKMSKQR